MQDLIITSKMTSMQIAEVTGKRHSDILRDIRDEAEKLQVAGIEAERKFALSERKDPTGRTIPYYELTKEGVLQLAARYDAVIRSKLIDLAMRSERQYSNLSPELQAIFTHDRMIQEVNSRVEKLENTMTIDYTQQEIIRELANRTVISALGGKDTQAYKLLSNKAFAEFWRHYKRVMVVNSYKNTPKIDFEKAREFTINWKPSQELSLMIAGANIQKSA